MRPSPSALAVLLVVALAAAVAVVSPAVDAAVLVAVSAVVAAVVVAAVSLAAVVVEVLAVEAVAFPGAVLAAEDAVASAGVAAGKAKRNGKTFRIHGNHTNAIFSFLSSAAAGNPPLHEWKGGIKQGGEIDLLVWRKGREEDVLYVQRAFFTAFFYWLGLFLRRT